MAVIGASFLFAPLGFSAGEDIINGKWKDNSCKYTNFYGKGYIKRTYKFDVADGEALLKVKVYPSKECETKSFEYRIYGDLETEVTDEAKRTGKFAVKYRRQTIRVKTAEVAKSFNQRRVCGFTDWKIGKEFDVNGLNCLGMAVPRKGTVKDGVYDVSKKGDDMLIVFNNINGKKHSVTFEKVED